MIGTVAMIAAERKRRQRQNPNGYGLSRMVDWKALGIDPTFTWADFLDLIVEQQGVCPICSREVSQRDVLDHRHVDGRVRNVLHGVCNFKVGRVEAGLEPASSEIASYLQKWS